jgi:3-deoxy-D-manno-octulosonate 8-phosphate phosphatase (KDO 8-P phosphatase)
MDPAERSLDLKEAPDLVERARRIKMILMDADGVLTDGKIIFLTGGSEAKMFDSKDGVGIKLAQRAGLKTGVISGRESEALLRRCEELGMDEIHQHVFEKLEAYEEIRSRLGLGHEECCFIGDDLVDAPVLKRVGLPVTVADAHPALEPLVAYVTERPGGAAAVREVIDLIIKAQGKWDQVVGRYL